MFYSSTHDCPGLTPPQRGYDEQNWSPPVQGNRAPVETAEQRNRRLSGKANNDGVDLHDQGDIHGAMRQYKIALQYWPDNEIAKGNLANCLKNYSCNANNRGVELARQGNLEEATRHYRLALQYWPDNGTAANNLAISMDNLRRRDEKAELERLTAESEKKIDSIFGRAKDDFDGRSSGAKQKELADFGLKFADSVGDQSAGHNDPSVVDLRDKTSDVVDPRVVRGLPPKAEFQTKTGVLLDALEKGNGNWRSSVDWLKTEVVKNPASGETRDAYQFVLGLENGLSNQGGGAPLDDLNIPDIPGHKWTYTHSGSHDLVMSALSAVAHDDFEEAYRRFSAAFEKEPLHLGIRDCLHWNQGMMAAKQAISSDPFLDPELGKMLAGEHNPEWNEFEKEENRKSLLEYARQFKKQIPGSSSGDGIR